MTAIDCLRIIREKSEELEKLYANKNDLEKVLIYQQIIALDDIWKRIYKEESSDNPFIVDKNHQNML